MPMPIKISAGRPGFHNRDYPGTHCGMGTGLSTKKEEVGDAEVIDF